MAKNLLGNIQIREDKHMAMCSLCGGGSDCSCGACGVCNCASNGITAEKAWY